MFIQLADYIRLDKIKELHTQIYRLPRQLLNTEYSSVRGFVIL